MEGIEAGPAHCDGCPVPIYVSAPWKSHDPGTRLLNQGGASDHVLRVRSGAVILSAVNAEGEELACCLRGPGATVNLESLAQRPLQFDVEAITAVEICHVPVPVLRQIVRGGGADSVAVLDLFAGEQTRWVDDRLRDSGASATQRLARLLLRLHELDIRPADLPRSVLARILSIRPETVSRAAAELRLAGAIGGSLELADLKRLGEVARGD